MITLAVAIPSIVGGWYAHKGYVRYLHKTIRKLQKAARGGIR